MQKDINLRLNPKDASEVDTIKRVFASETGIALKDINAVRIIKRSVDARQRNIFVNLTVRGYINEPEPVQMFEATGYPNVSGGFKAIVVGLGPAGLFAALRLIELGICPIVVERGKNVRDRKLDTARISKNHVVDPDSNYCFGEGGAGAFSDGKLYTRSKKRGNVDKILNTFCQYGASTDILIDAHPHIGTDKLPGIIERMRLQIEASGGEVHFQTRMEELIIESGKVRGIKTHRGDTIEGPVILATGHSARDVYRMLKRQGVKIEAKGLAVGVRVEHPAELIDCIQYHNEAGRGEYLPAAEYSFTVQAEGRGVYSFCMCPGGTVVPSASGAEQVVVNGMSASGRGSHWSNSGIVVEVHPEDFPEYTQYEELCLLRFQEDLEKLAWQAGGATQVAPAQRMYDFVKGKQSGSLPRSSYAPGVVSSPMHEWLPPFVSNRLQKAFKEMGKRQKGFLTNEALLLGVESRTSSPVRIIRDRETMQHIELKGLFPCGEGAGYAGGIVSAAMDGERSADALSEYLKTNRLL
ncbi:MULTISPECIES: NAD(P)/FAD-dependent oxidoreductase [unclassified Dysgonomonas]|uniref:NAD(P)/FAD-dependent oxidoreductase n=1 Tax=unclassified Dysgonomonas TaxID=2630389 RepID=UPI0024742450|nr:MULTISPECIES: FAD-binding protein [unclassified Dysgonomonas]